MCVDIVDILWIPVEEGGQAHAEGGEHGPDDGGEPQPDLVAEDPHQEGEEEGRPYRQRPDQSWQNKWKWNGN